MIKEKDQHLRQVLFYCNHLEMMKTAQFFLEKSTENPIDYVAKYKEELFEETECEDPGKSEEPTDVEPVEAEEEPCTDVCVRDAGRSW